MDHGCRSMVNWNTLEIRRSLWIILVMAFGAVLVFQFFNLPYGSALSSLLSAGKVSFVSNSKDVYSLNQSNSSHNVSNLKKEGRNKDDCLLVTNGTCINNLGKDKEESSISQENVTSASAEQPLSVAHNSSHSPAPSPTNSNIIIMIPPTSSPILSPTHGIAKTRSAVSISQMNLLLLEAQSAPKSTQPQPYLALDEELARAKLEIQNTPLVQNDSDLYEPLYRNVSKFIRSYEMMEKKLRVYIYKEGDKPIFHDSILKGIYASEGWFIKLLESNNQFVTQDPSKAHLFFLPFSSRLLQRTLYARSSQNRTNLIVFIENYVDMLIQKYPFWNRTNGEDHFLAACHDWALSETSGRMLSCLRALCNANIKRGFVVGKDVSLPTVNVHSAKNPLKDIGGKPSSKRSILAFFAGQMHGNVRPLLLKHWAKDPDMKILDRMPHVQGDKNYIQYLKTSKYCICPRGYQVHSPRVVESIWFGCVPVIISDNYVPPFFEVLNWESFAVFILQKDIPNLKKILKSISDKKYAKMVKRVKEVKRHFLWHDPPVKYDMFHLILHSVWYNRIHRIKSA